MTTEATQTEQTPTTTDAKRCPHRGKRWLWLSVAGLVLIGLVASLACSLYSLSQLKAKSRYYHGWLKSQGRELSSVQSAGFNLKVRVQKVDSRLAATQTSLTALQKRMQFLDFEQLNWAESDYLVQLAVYNVEIAQNPRLAEKLLLMSYKRMQSNETQKGLKLKQLLMDDIVALRAVPEPNLEKILQQLNALNGQVDNLPLHVPNITETAQSSRSNPTKGRPQTTTKNTPIPAWQSHLLTAWHELLQLVSIRRITGDHPELLAADQQSYLLQNLHLLLQQARWAALNRQPAIYQQSLTAIAKWVQQYFSYKSAIARSFLDQIKTLQALNIAPKLPDITPTLVALRQMRAKPTPALIRTKHQAMTPTRVLELMPGTTSTTTSTHKSVTKSHTDLSAKVSSSGQKTHSHHASATQSIKQ